MEFTEGNWDFFFGLSPHKHRASVRIVRSFPLSWSESSGKTLQQWPAFGKLSERRWLGILTKTHKLTLSVEYTSGREQS